MPQFVIRKKVHFPLVLSLTPRLNPHADCSFFKLSCSCSKCDSFENSEGLCVIYSQTAAFFQQRTSCNMINVANFTLCQATSGMKCLPLILFDVFIWLSTSVPHKLYTMSCTLHSPRNSAYYWVHRHLISSGFTIWNGCAISCPQWLSGVPAQGRVPHGTATDRMHVRTHWTGMDKTGQRYESFCDWASPNQHVDMWEVTGNTGNRTCLFGDCISCHQLQVGNIWKSDTKYSDIQPRGSWRIFGDASVTIAQWRRVRDLTNLGYPQVPGLIPAETLSTQINMDLSA